MRWRTRGAERSHSPKITRSSPAMPRPLGPPAAPGMISMSAALSPEDLILSRARVPARMVRTELGIIGQYIPMSHLFTPLTLRGVTFPNRIFVSPMCQYSSDDGMPNEWHYVHLGSRAVGGAALVSVEASAVSPEARITPWDAGIWSSAHAAAWKPIADFIRERGAVPAIQIAHAGRKASCNKPWAGGKPLAASEGGWKTLGPSEIAFGAYPPPKAMTIAETEAAIEDSRSAAEFSLAAGFDVVEVHGAHGYLLHSFASPLSNRRTDDYGGSFEN